LRSHNGQRPVEVANHHRRAIMKFPGIVLALAAVTLATPTLSNAQANHDYDVCGVHTLRGTYVFAASGFNIVAGVAQPKAIIEVIEFNGDGTLSVPSATLSVNGVIVRPPPSIGTYTVESDCSGTILFGGPTFDIFISSRAAGIWMIQTNSNSVFQGTATRTSPGRGPR
jgi:hypothetical protein